MPKYILIKYCYFGITLCIYGTTNPGGTQKLDNPFNEIGNPSTCNLNNPLKGIRNLVKIYNPDPVAKRVNHTNLRLAVATKSRHKLV